MELGDRRQISGRQTSFQGVSARNAAWLGDICRPVNNFGFVRYGHLIPLTLLAPCAQGKALMRLMGASSSLIVLSSERIIQRLRNG